MGMKNTILMLLMIFWMFPVVSFAGQLSQTNSYPKEECISLTKNLKYQSRDAKTNREVSKLENFLWFHGYLKSKPTGYFSIVTKRATQAFQHDYGLSADGYVGLSVRKKIQEISCNGNTKVSPLFWNLHVLVLDKIDRKEKADIPLEEAIKFIEQRSRFKFKYEVTQYSGFHGYTKYNCDNSEECVVVNYSDISSSRINALPVADSYLFLWNAGKNIPLHAGSTWWVEYGILKEGIKRPYATVPADPWWYNNEPYEGFNSRAAQILAHELINTISAKIEVEPYNCEPLVGTDGDPATKHEGDRLAKLNEECYRKILKYN